MSGAGIVMGTVGLGMVIIAGVFALKTFGSGGGAETADARFMAHLDAAEIGVELERLRGLPGEPVPVNVGQVADAMIDCVAELMPGKPGSMAQEAGRRYFVIVHAINARIESPLIDPRVRGKSAAAVDDKAFRRLLANYASTAHPIYSGLDFDAKGFDRADFEKVVIAQSANTKQVKACADRRAGG